MPKNFGLGLIGSYSARQKETTFQLDISAMHTDYKLEFYTTVKQ